MFLLVGMTVVGCYAAGRSTVKLVEADRKLAEARVAGAPERAKFAWTMADEYMKKARDEWANSDYEDAEAMVVKAKEWADQAIQIANNARPLDLVSPVPEIAPVPEQQVEEPIDFDVGEEGLW